MTINTINDLKPDPNNANRGTERGHEIVNTSIQRHGAGRSGLAAKDGTMIAGSQTLKEMAALGMKIKPVHTTGDEWVVVIRDDVEPGSEQATLMGLEDNRGAQEGIEWDPGILAELAQQFDVSGLFTGDELAEWAQPSEPEAGAGGDEFDTTPDEGGETRAQLGDLWIIGGVHRLLVGDCTDPANVARLMGGERAQVVATDPPYAVAYVEKARDMHERGYGHSRATLSTAIEGDEIDEKQAEQIWRGAFGAALESAAGSHAAWYIWHGDKSARLLYLVLNSLEMLHHQIIIWSKNNFVIGRLDYQSKHELCWYGWKQGNRPPFLGEKSQTTVWEIGRDLNPEHPTQKPIALYEPPLINHTKPGDILYDCFAGSGPALIAAHRHGRRAYLIEKSPARADVILRRAEAEGLSVELVPSS